MDKNKLKVLQDIDYKIQKTCGLCQHGDFGLSYAKQRWGTCKIQKYEHLKHTGDKRDLSINIYGYCDKFQAQEIEMAGLEKFIEFMKD